MANAEGHTWEFKARFRRSAFGWRSQPAIQRVKQAVREIKKVARREPALAADGAVCLLERLSPALERVDSSSGAIGSAVNRAIDDLCPITAGAPADATTRAAWLERLWDAHEADQMPYIEVLADYWGELCASKEVASAWADRLVEITRMALSPDKTLRGHFHGTPACLSVLYRAERFAEILDILQTETFWHYKRWAVRALAAVGETSEGIRMAEWCRGPWAPDAEVDALCEEFLLEAGQVDEAYRRYGLRANGGGTYLATFRNGGQEVPRQNGPRAPGQPGGHDAGRRGQMVRRRKGGGPLRRGARPCGAVPLRPQDAHACRAGFQRGAAILRGGSRPPRTPVARPGAC